MTFFDSIKTCLQKIVNWRGRASRSEFWYFHLFILIVCFCTSFISDILQQTGIIYFISINSSTTGFLFIFAFASLYIAHMSVTIRRLHDINHSGFSYLTYIVPLIGLYLMLTELSAKGTLGSNRYGSDPLGEDL